MNRHDEFLKKHNIKILDTNKRFARFRPVSYDYFTDELDYNLVSNRYNHYDTERLFTIEIPESDLAAIEDFEEQVFNNMKNHGLEHYNLFNIMMDQKQEEKYLRDKYPAVKKAYEHYSLMLKLAASGEL